LNGSCYTYRTVWKCRHNEYQRWKNISHYYGICRWNCCASDLRLHATRRYFAPLGSSSQMNNRQETSFIWIVHKQFTRIKCYLRIWTNILAVSGDTFFVQNDQQSSSHPRTVDSLCVLFVYSWSSYTLSLFTGRKKSKSSKLILYHGQEISHEDSDKLKSNLGGLHSMNTFLSTIVKTKMLVYSMHNRRIYSY